MDGFQVVLSDMVFFAVQAQGPLPDAHTCADGFTNFLFTGSAPVDVVPASHLCFRERRETLHTRSFVHQADHFSAMVVDLFKQLSCLFKQHLAVVGDGGALRERCGVYGAVLRRFW